MKKWLLQVDSKERLMPDNFYGLAHKGSYYDPFNLGICLKEVTTVVTSFKQIGAPGEWEVFKICAMKYQSVGIS